LRLRSRRHHLPDGAARPVGRAAAAAEAAVVVAAVASVGVAWAVGAEQVRKYAALALRVSRQINKGKIA
jgi:hypothetical protein